MVDTVVDFKNTVHLRYTKLKQHKLKSGPRENGAKKRCGKHKIYESADGITLQLFVISRKSAL